MYLYLIFMTFIISLATPARKKARFSFYAATVNDDWANVASNLGKVMPHADVIFLQEAKRDHLKSMVDLEKWFVFQDWTNPATAGSAVLVRKEVFPHIGKSGLSLGTVPHGRKMLTRYIAWVVAWHIAKHKFWFSSGHRPPIRYAMLWRFYDVALAARVRIAQGAGRIVVHGSDTNHKNPTKLAKLCGLKLVVPDKNSIDALLVSKRVKVLSVTRLPQWTSDHHPVVAHLEI